MLQLSQEPYSSPGPTESQAAGLGATSTPDYNLDLTIESLLSLYPPNESSAGDQRTAIDSSTDPKTELMASDQAMASASGLPAYNPFNFQAGFQSAAMDHHGLRSIRSVGRSQRAPGSHRRTQSLASAPSTPTTSGFPLYPLAESQANIHSSPTISHFPSYLSAESQASVQSAPRTSGPSSHRRARSVAGVQSSPVTSSFPLYPLAESQDGIESVTDIASPSPLRRTQSQATAQSAQSSSRHGSHRRAQSVASLQSAPPTSGFPLFPLSESQATVQNQASTAGPSSHRRTQSLASVQSTASTASPEGDQPITVPLAEITKHISGPDLADGKYTCTFEGCSKKFGRKENIKSHVQTHLNDRQFECSTCLKRFVRQHDLKRHAKIHTGNKPYNCDCGNSFARHDALTRHRQRGMCVGAFDGSVKKSAKRGRPRKHQRPDMDERREKSERTRKKNMSTSSVSLQSAYGGDSPASNMVSSPVDTAMDAAMDTAMDDMVDLSQAIGGYNTTAPSSAPMPTIGQPAVQPQAIPPSASTTDGRSTNGDLAFVDPRMCENMMNLSQAVGDYQISPHTANQHAVKREPGNEYGDSQYAGSQYAGDQYASNQLSVNQGTDAAEPALSPVSLSQPSPIWPQAVMPASSAPNPPSAASDMTSPLTPASDAAFLLADPDNSALADLTDGGSSSGVTVKPEDPNPDYYNGENLDVTENMFNYDEEFDHMFMNPWGGVEPVGTG
ncbi:Metallothionein expression activator-like protein [Hapsidospora chrysogenum ATCC 11550]|uniref:Metallothionein expression activator-like protein n=1 Tax=Hapsidospora chrysogenum (strain ATCC 11550 / CBS 779.69 / DSM 880 / IAM 14645 / JCM 23072 / IMI 49137) TaxID=857340 RepID=A0A086T8R3_HAPC1|nr:Metallothionein expression activator-like protein [Hapsidospora chrysogenum ATCC 11550]